MQKFDAENWNSEIRPQVVQATREAFSQYKEGDELELFVKKWQDRIIVSFMEGLLTDPVLETHAEAENQLRRLEGLHSKFHKDLMAMGNFSKLQLDTIADQEGLSDYEYFYNRMSTILNVTLDNMRKSRDRFEHLELKTNEPRRVTTTILYALFDAYIDITGEQPKAPSSNSANGRLYGSSYEFIRPFLDIFDPVRCQGILDTGCKNIRCASGLLV